MSEEEQAVYDAAKALVAFWKSGGDGQPYPPPNDAARALAVAVDEAIAAE